jgi:heme-degrading monooxygenase HmoA
MFARNVSIQLKPNTLTEFTRTMDSEILPLLRKQKGFQDEITLSAPTEREVVAISFWDNRESAEAYNSTAYPEVLKILAKYVDGTPHIRTFNVGSSTTRKVAASVAA